MPFPRPLSVSAVLVVEDDEMLRMCAANVVADAGFTPVEAANADEAVNRHRSGTQVGWPQCFDVARGNSFGGSGSAPIGTRLSAKFTTKSTGWPSRSPGVPLRCLFTA